MRFAKLHGAGNDFLLFDGRADAGLEDALPALVPGLCHRRLGLGADGVLLLLPGGERVVRLRYWNADGSAAAFCANGTRCAARFVAERWGWPRHLVETGWAAIEAEVRQGRVTLRLPPPAAAWPWRELEGGGAAVTVRYLVVGVPHLVVPVAWPDFWRRPLAPLAPALRRHPDLPDGGANVHLVRHRHPGPLEVRSFERGVEGETLACGSGVVAAGLVAAAEGWRPAPVAVLTASGRALEIAPEGTPPLCPSRLTGPAEWVAEGEIAAEILGSEPRTRSPEPAPRDS